MKPMKQKFHKHRYMLIATNETVHEFLYQCEKCGLYAVIMGVGIEYKTSKFPANKGWERVKKEVGE